MTTTVHTIGRDDVEQSILTILAHGPGTLDWICQRVEDLTDPADSEEAKHVPDEQLEAWLAEATRRRPGRMEVEKALARLANLGMLTCDGTRWSMTGKGYAAV